ncbi:MAG: lactate utilization protein [Deltaproteobacteria bacterium]|nr:lactate utilization protein [Candidatus Zymogenaceae bacterium]
MKIEVEEFKRKANEGLNNAHQRELLGRLPVIFKALRDYSFSTLADPKAALERGAAIRRESIANLPAYLEAFEKKAVENGANIVWAEDYREAREIIIDLARKKKVKTITKGKSMLTEEMELNRALGDNGIDVFETDLGEFIVQQMNRTPFHVVGPALNVAVEEIADLFVSVMGVEKTLDLGGLTMQARGFLREKFKQAEMGITGVNMAVADTGSIILVENEGNIRFSTGGPKTHVAVMGIEKIVPTMDDALHVLRLLTRSCTGQAVSSYVNVINGPKKKGEPDGPDELFIVIVDGGRTKIYADPDFRQVLGCIKCGACLNVCPVWNKIGGYAYGWVYSGPIGSILNPLFLGLERAHDLYHATTLCGACREVCPAGIDHPRLFLKLREKRASGDRTWGARRLPLAERLTFSAWAWGISGEGRYRTAGKLLRWMLKPFVTGGVIGKLPAMGSGWTRFRDLPAPAERPFRRRWSDGERGTTK